MYLSVSIDAAVQENAYAGLVGAAQRIEAAAADFAILARDECSGVLAPSRVEAVVTLPWLCGLLRTPVVVAGIPALHSLPFHVARALSAADFLSQGRAGWAPLTSARDRYDAAYGSSYAVAGDAVGAKYDDFVQATQALWDSWDDDALVIDKVSGVYLNSGRVRRVDYRGSHFATMGALNAARPPQGYPLLLRDLGDVASSALRCDVALGDAEQLARGPAGAVRLMRVTTDTLNAGVDAIAKGAADGLHLTGSAALDMLEALRSQHPVSAAGGATARERLGLAKLTNSHSEKAAA